MLKIRSGIGYDLHRIGPGKGLVIGGITVAENIQFIAHSDGDVLIHAIIDSLLGAIGEKDIGELFPDSDRRYKGIKSSLLLKETLSLLKEKQMEIINIDCVIIAEIPKISPYKEQIKANIVSLLSIKEADFNLKAKSKEQIDTPVGRGEAIECFCTSLVQYMD